MEVEGRRWSSLRWGLVIPRNSWRAMRWCRVWIGGVIFCIVHIATESCVSAKSGAVDWCFRGSAPCGRDGDWVTGRGAYRQPVSCTLGNARIPAGRVRETDRGSAETKRSVRWGAGEGRSSEEAGGAKMDSWGRCNCRRLVQDRYVDQVFASRTRRPHVGAGPSVVSTLCVVWARVRRTLMAIKVGLSVL